MQPTSKPTAPVMTETRGRAARLLQGAIGDAALADKVEKHVFNWALTHCKSHGHELYWENRAFRHAYTSKAVNVRQTLLLHADVLERLCSRRLGAKTLVFGKPWEIKPEKWEGAFERAAHRQMRREQLMEQSFDGILTCGSCKSKKVMYSMAQTRSADEPMTVFAFCTECSRRWKQNS